VHRVADASGTTRIGRFGWKADVVTLDEMVAAAFADEMGMPSLLAPRPPLQVRDDGAMAHAVAAFLRGRPAPQEVARGGLPAKTQERAQ